MVKHFSDHMILSQSPCRYTGFVIKVVLHITVLRKPQVLTIHFRDPHKFSEEAVVCFVIFISSIWGFPELQANPRSSENLKSAILNYSNSPSSK